MARDNHPRARQEKRLARKLGKRAPVERVLIVTEGTKTEPNYFDEIRNTFRLPTANIKVLHSKGDTCPLNIVNYTKNLFINGDSKQKVNPRAFESVYVVFDRDDHKHYYDALEKAQAISIKKIFNDQKRAIQFKAIVSVPNFELWLLLHFEECLAPIHRQTAINRLKKHIENYEKGCVNSFELTKDYYDKARQRAISLSKVTNAWNGEECYSDVHLLVDKLFGMKK